jgi:hypothetical protein
MICSCYIHDMELQRIAPVHENIYFLLSLNLYSGEFSDIHFMECFCPPLIDAREMTRGSLSLLDPDVQKFMLRTFLSVF